MRRRVTSARRESGQVFAIVAIMLPVLLAIGGIVVGVGNWYTHARHLQTKADAGALAGGTGFEFPCGPPGVNAIDTRIADLARLYAGSNNPQVGGVQNSQITTWLNAPTWYDNDNPSAPSNEDLDICDDSVPMRLDVKVTENDSFPLFSLIPIFPDIKRKAVVEIQEAEGVSGMLPIAVRAPEPKSALAIFYNEANGAILDRKYLIKSSTISSLPPALQGWSTENPADPNAQGWASVAVQERTGVVIGIAYRGACNTWDPALYPSGPPAGVVTESGPCLEDGFGPGATSFTTVDQICNQGGSLQVVNCYYANGTFPSETVQSGLHFIRGYSGTPSSGLPELGSAYLSPGSCSTGYGSGYFASFPAVCDATLTANIDVGSCFRLPQGGGWTGPCVDPSVVPTATQTRTAANVEVKYTVVFGTQNNDDSCDFGNTCDLADSGSGAGYSASGPVDLTPGGTNVCQPQCALGLRIRFKDTFVAGRPNCSNNNFNGQCEWYFVGFGRVLTQPTNQDIFDHPVQRAFRGNTVNAGSIKFLRLKADRSACTPLVPADEFAYGGEEGSHPASATSCFVVEMGMKGANTDDADDEPVLFNDGVGPSQMGYLDCTATGPQNIVWEVMNGCPPLYARNNFNTVPYCPSANNLFTQPNPGPPFDNGEWPPLRCVKTRPTSQGNDLIKGLNGRLFDPTNPNPSPNPPNTCPPQVGPGYTQGRNYWKNNATTNPNYGFQEDDGSWLTKFDLKDSRLAAIFLTTPESFTGSGQNTYPVLGAVAIYITGFGRIAGNGSIQVDDPCAGPLPSDIDTSGGSTGGRVIWGHIIDRAFLSASATPSGDPCNPQASTQVCVAVLVE